MAHRILLIVTSLVLACHGLPSPQKKVLEPPGKVVIDTDMGSDDAMGVLLALSREQSNQSGVKVVAITCVNGNTKLNDVVVNVLKTLKTVSRLDIPVYSGASRSLLITPKSDNYFGTDGFGDFDFVDAPNPKDYLKKEHAATALVRLVTENPGELTIICLGPLTNIALAIRLDPSFLSKVKQLAVMGGSVEGVGNIKPGIEFNSYVDPEANFIVFNSTDTTDKSIKPIVLLPWESVYMRNKIQMKWRTEVLGMKKTPQMELLNNAERLVLRNNGSWVSADPMLSAAVLFPEIITRTEAQFVSAEVEGLFARGALFVDYMNTEHRSPNVVIIEDIDVQQYENNLFQYL